MRKKPEVLQISTVAKSRLFRIEALDLQFSNGEKRTFERVQTQREAVLVLPIYQDSLLLIREYAVGVDRYELGFVKGIQEPGESPEEAANRELQEEAGFAGRQFRYVDSVTLAPGYFGAITHIVLAQDLYPAKAQGDEPEPPEVVAWPLDNLDTIFLQTDFTEARCMCALFMLKNIIKQEELL